MKTYVMAALEGVRVMVRVRMMKMMLEMEGLI